MTYEEPFSLDSLLLRGMECMCDRVCVSVCVCLHATCLSLNQVTEVVGLMWREASHCRRVKGGVADLI